MTGVDSARRLLQQYANTAANDGPRYYGIWLDSALVGGALFRRFDAAAGIAEVGAWLIPRAEGRGLVTAAFRAMIVWAFEMRGINRVELRASPGNERGWKIAARLGMTRERLIRGEFTLNGTSQDSELWAVNAEQWQGVVVR